MRVIWKTTLLLYLTLSLAAMSTIQGDEIINLQNAKPEKIVLQRETYSEHPFADLKSLRGIHSGVHPVTRLMRGSSINKGILSTRDGTTPLSFEYAIARTKERELNVNEIYQPQVLLTVNRRSVVNHYDEDTPYRRQIIIMSILQNLMKRKFQSWGGKRSSNPLLRKKRESVSGWGGRIRYQLAPGMSDLCSSQEASVVLRPKDKSPVFNAWGGKRSSTSSSKQMLKLNWHDRRGHRKNKIRFPASLLHKDIGAVTVDKKNFHAWGGKRSFPFMSKERSLLAGTTARFSTYPTEAGIPFHDSGNERDHSIPLGCRSAFKSWEERVGELSFRNRPLDNNTFSDKTVSYPGSDDKRRSDQFGQNLVPILRPDTIPGSRTTRSINIQEAGKEVNGKDERISKGTSAGEKWLIVS